MLSLSKKVIFFRFSGYTIITVSAVSSASSVSSVYWKSTNKGVPAEVATNRALGIRRKISSNIWFLFFMIKIIKYLYFTILTATSVAGWYYPGPDLIEKWWNTDCRYKKNTIVNKKNTERNVYVCRSCFYCSAKPTALQQKSKNSALSITISNSITHRYEKIQKFR